jgi:hypothetical protein
MAKKKIEEVKEASEINALIKRTDCADPAKKDIIALKTILDEKPYLVEFFGNQQKQIFLTIFDWQFKDSHTLKEATGRQVKQMKQDFGYDNSTITEKMLIDEILIRWLRLQYTERLHHEKLRFSQTIEAGNYYEKMLSTAQARFLKAVTTLTKVRKMIAQTQRTGAKMFRDLVETKDEPKRLSD